MRRFFIAFGTSLLTGMALSGCASELERGGDIQHETATLAQVWGGSRSAPDSDGYRQAAIDPSAGEAVDQPLATVERLPRSNMRRTSAVGGITSPEFQGEPINATLPSQPLPEFVNTVLGDILGLPFSLGPGVAERRDMVALRSVRDMPEHDFYRLFETAISDYGLALVFEQGLVQVVERSFYLSCS